MSSAKETKLTSLEVRTDTLLFLRLTFQNMISGPLSYRVFRETGLWFETWADIVLCSWARHFTLTVRLSTQAYKWVPLN